MSGIERDVFLWSQPKASIQDFRVVSTLDDTYTNGIFKLAVDLKNHTQETKNLNVGYELLDAKGNLVTSEANDIWVSPASPQTASFEYDLKNVAPWSAEHPNLYKLLMTIKEEGKVIEVVPFNVGFRRFEMKQIDQVAENGKPYTVLLFNGQPVKFKGVNIHEHNPETGHYVTEELMRKDFELMKQNNINAVRRMVRDARTRGTSAKQTIAMWQSVRRGEENNIFPYQEDADVMFNSALLYELAVLKAYAEPILFGIEKDCAEYQEAKRLLKFLDYFVGIGSEYVPQNSILREFIGGGCFDL